jgi:hypothetical protein
MSTLRPQNVGSPDTTHVSDICVRGEEVMKYRIKGLDGIGLKARTRNGGNGCVIAICGSLEEFSACYPPEGEPNIEHENFVLGLAVWPKSPWRGRAAGLESAMRFRVEKRP